MPLRKLLLKVTNCVCEVCSVDWCDRGTVMASAFIRDNSICLLWISACCFGPLFSYPHKNTLKAAAFHNISSWRRSNPVITAQTEQLCPVSYLDLKWTPYCGVGKILCISQPLFVFPFLERMAKLDCMTTLTPAHSLECSLCLYVYIWKHLLLAGWNENLPTAGENSRDVGTGWHFCIKQCSGRSEYDYQNKFCVFWNPYQGILVVSFGEQCAYCSIWKSFSTMVYVKITMYCNVLGTFTIYKACQVLAG